MVKDSILSQNADLELFVTTSGVDKQEDFRDKTLKNSFPGAVIIKPQTGYVANIGEKKLSKPTNHELEKKKVSFRGNSSCQKR